MPFIACLFPLFLDYDMHNIFYSMYFVFFINFFIEIFSPLTAVFLWFTILFSFYRFVLHYFYTFYMDIFLSLYLTLFLHHKFFTLAMTNDKSGTCISRFLDLCFVGNSFKWERDHFRPFNNHSIVFPCGCDIV